MIVGTEWIIDAFDCDADSLRDLQKLQFVFAKINADLNLKAVKETWHQFEGEKGVTGLILLTESHLACHTYPNIKPRHSISTAADAPCLELGRKSKKFARRENRKSSTNRKRQSAIPNPKS